VIRNETIDKYYFALGMITFAASRLDYDLAMFAEVLGVDRRRAERKGFDLTGLFRPSVVRE
jgi:hypothetical protein